MSPQSYNGYQGEDTAAKVKAAVEQRERQKSYARFKASKIEEAKPHLRLKLSHADKWQMICDAEKKYGIGAALEAWAKKEWPDFEKPRTSLIDELAKMDPVFWGKKETVIEEVEDDDEF